LLKPKFLLSHLKKISFCVKNRRVINVVKNGSIFIKIEYVGPKMRKVEKREKAKIDFQVSNFLRELQETRI
jgi:hypothetical protein